MSGSSILKDKNDKNSSEMTNLRLLKRRQGTISVPNRQISRSPSNANHLHIDMDTMDQ